MQKTNEKEKNDFKNNMKEKKLVNLSEENTVH